MCRVRSCCFCCSLRTGTYIAAIYTLIITVMVILTSILALVNLDTNLDDALGTTQTGDAVQGDESDKSTLGKIVYYTTAILYVAWFISAILVIVGILKERRGFLLPWLIITTIIVVIAGIALIMSCFDIKKVFKDGSRATNFILQCVVFGVSVYMVIVVLSFYRNNLKEADER